MFENILLEKEQEELLCLLVEAARNVPREQRHKFWAADIHGSYQSVVKHGGLPNGQGSAFIGDIETLGHVGLLALTYEDKGLVQFDITPPGFKYYAYLKQRDGQPIQRIEVQSRNYLNSDLFQRKYPQAYQKWANAEILLWSSDSEQQLTTVGHLCRESLQEFASALVDQFKPPNVDSDKAHTIKRIRAVLYMLADRLGTTQKFFDVLITYWETVNDLIQRQEHGGQKEGHPLIWDDARRVVFQSAVVMLEISKNLEQIKGR
jgi:hypothetical protein